MACIGEKTGSMVIDKITAVVFVVVVRFFVESKVVGHLFPEVSQFGGDVGLLFFLFSGRKCGANLF